ncbi:MAG: hypothetical protein ACI95C_000639 [Pseudohongiellaceae bacterium]|jgi:hypothetical protein
MPSFVRAQQEPLRRSRNSPVGLARLILAKEMVGPPSSNLRQMGYEVEQSRL